MNRLPSTLFCLLAGAAIASAIEPNFVKSTLYNVDGASSNIVSTVYSDGLGRETQGKVSLGIKDRAVSTFYDGAGRKKIVTKPFLDSINAGNFNSGDFDSINEILKANYSMYPSIGGDPFAYSQVEYYNDNTGRVKRSSSPGKDNRLGSGHEVKNWYFGVAKEVQII